MNESHPEDQHPSYGTVQFSRTTGRTSLFGCPMEVQNFIRLEVHEAEVLASELTGRTTPFNRRLPLVEVWLSATQFAEAITQMNVGMGVPATIVLKRDGKPVRVESPPRQRSEASRVRDLFKAKVQSKLRDLQAMEARMKVLLDGAKIGAAKRNEITGMMQSFVRLLGDTAPFMMGQFEEATVEAASTAKTEVMAFVDHVVRATGVEVLGTQGLLSEHTEGDRDGEDE